MSTMLRTENLTYSYPAGEENEQPTLALDGVTLAIERGSFTVILGHNGSGKSTLAKTFNAVLLPSGGRVYVDGMDTVDETLLLEIRRRVGMVFQNPDNQMVATLIEDDVAFGPENIGVPREEIIERVNWALEAVDMTEYRTRSASKLSGGQRRRIDIARALIHKPELLILDEPTTGLDPQTRKLLWDVVRDLRIKEGMTVLLTTHYMEEAADADYVVIIDSGKISAEGTPLELKNKYTGDFITLYGLSKEQIEGLGLPYETVRDAVRISVPNTAAATELIIKHPELFSDYEITKGKMDDVFLAVTGKKPEGAENR